MFTNSRFGYLWCHEQQVGLGLGQVNTRKGIILWGEGLLDLVENVLTWLALDVLITDV